MADPYTELLANLKSANEDVDYQCKFPFRTKLLSRAGLWTPRSLSCPGLLNWKNVFSKQKLHMAFASQYMSNPASVFGHTFFIFSPDRSSDNPYPEYLDLTLGYAAQMPPRTGAYQYLTKGLGGGFPGRFFDEPLYKRVHEYSNMEFRDIWIYPLSISEEKTDDLLDYVWELGLRPYFGYYFLDENCSFILLEILDAIFPEENLTKDFPLWVLPVESLKTLKSKKMLGEGRIIPSMRRKFLNGYDRLTDQERSQVKKAIAGKLEKLKTKEAMDVMITYYDKRKLEKGISSLEDQKNYQSLLATRSTLGPRSDDVKKYNVLDPINSHYPTAFSLRTGKLNDSSFQEIELRPVVHELLDFSSGYIEHSQIKLLTPTLRLNDRGGMRLQQFQFADIANIVPFRLIDPIYSWKLNLERTHLQDKLCFDCSVTRLRFGIGMSFAIGEYIKYYILPGISADWGDSVAHNFRSGAGLFNGFILDLSEKLKFNTSFDYFTADEWGKSRQTIFRPGIEGSFNLNQSFSIRSTYREWHTFPVTVPSKEMSLSSVFSF